jgi:hypothetical protein
MPFEANFPMTVLRSFGSKQAAVSLEADMIAHHGTRDPEKGYNTLPSTPGSSAVFWMQYRRRQRAN